MKKSVWILLLSMILSANVFAADDFKAGQHYKEIEPQKTATGDKIEVLEFFWYGCPHCYTFEPFLNKWKASKPDNVVFTRVPAIFRPSWKVQARTYYALEAMGKLDPAHQQIFDAIHKKRTKLTSMNQMADFLAKNGIDRDAFVKEYRSFSVDSKVRKANKLLKAYNVSGVPTVAVNGKYMTDGRSAGSYPKMIEVMNHLIKKESK